MLMEVHADSDPQGDFVSFNGRGQVVEKSSRRRDHRSKENSEGEGEVSDSDVKRLDESILPRGVGQREPAKGLRKEKKTMREQNVFGVPFVCEQRSWGWEVIERDVQERKVNTGERREFVHESMVARLQQQRARS